MKSLATLALAALFIINVPPHEQLRCELRPVLCVPKVVEKPKTTPVYCMALGCPTGENNVHGH